jgi:NADPH:quinone reductase-like Zn-dependent oxidoreductase
MTSSSDEKLQRAKALGADHLINYRTVPDWDEEVLRITNGRGVDNIFENGGTQTTSKSLNCVALGGLINAIGYVTGKVDRAEERTNINVSLISKNAIYKGHINGPVDRIKEYYRFCEQHQLRPTIDKVYQFEEAVEALQYLWSGSHFGKVVIRISKP